MKENANNKTTDLTQSLMSQISNKNNQNTSISSNNYYSEEIIIPDNISYKEKEEIISQNKLYFLEYSKLLNDNNLLKLKLQELMIKKNKYKKCLNNHESKENNNPFLKNELSNIFINNKRRRRKKCQIIYKYKCKFNNCNKKYSTEGCLNQHMKLKHNNKK